MSEKAKAQAKMQLRKKQEAEQARRAEALRSNLKRRKAQVRARDDGDDSEPEGGGEPDAGQSA